MRMQPWIAWGDPSGVGLGAGANAPPTGANAPPRRTSRSPGRIFWAGGYLGKALGGARTSGRFTRQVYLRREPPTVVKTRWPSVSRSPLSLKFYNDQKHLRRDTGKVPIHQIGPHLAFQLLITPV